VEGAIPHVQGIEMYGNSIPAGTVGGDLFEYINFQQRYDIDARIQRALKRSRSISSASPGGCRVIQWTICRMAEIEPDYKPEMEIEYRDARSSEQVRVAEDLHELYSTAGVLVVDAQGHGIISAKSHPRFTTHFMPLCFPTRPQGKNNCGVIREDQLAIALSITARNALGKSEKRAPRRLPPCFTAKFTLMDIFDS